MELVGSGLYLVSGPPADVDLPAEKHIIHRICLQGEIRVQVESVKVAGCRITVERRTDAEVTRMPDRVHSHVEHLQ